MVQWSNGPMVQWSNGPMVQWSNGPMVCVCVCFTGVWFSRTCGILQVQMSIYVWIYSASNYMNSTIFLFAYSCAYPQPLCKLFLCRFMSFFLLCVVVFCCCLVSQRNQLSSTRPTLLGPMSDIRYLLTVRLMAYLNHLCL